MATKLLQRGDIINLEKGMTVYAEIPEKFYFCNTPFSSNLYKCDVNIGRTYIKEAVSKEELEEAISKRLTEKIINFFRISSISPELISNFSKDLIKKSNLNLSKETFDSSVFAGKYIVDYAFSDGGGSTHDGGYPSGHHVFCHKIDDPSISVDFYQTGCFTAMIPDITPINND